MGRCNPGPWGLREHGLELNMKDFFQDLRQKVLDIERVRKEIEALHCLRPHLHFRCFLHPAASVPGSDVEALE